MKETKEERAIRKKAQTVKNSLIKKQKRLEIKKISDAKKEQMKIEKDIEIESLKNNPVGLISTSKNKSHLAFEALMINVLVKMIEER